MGESMKRPTPMPEAEAIWVCGLQPKMGCATSSLFSILDTFSHFPGTENAVKVEWSWSQEETGTLLVTKPDQ